MLVLKRAEHVPGKGRRRLTIRFSDKALYYLNQLAPEAERGEWDTGNASVVRRLVQEGIAREVGYDSWDDLPDPPKGWKPPLQPPTV